uniref:Chloroplast-derived orf31 n=1 Tax=Zea mays TaxID=4577 RepID=Q37098_MAIZE|nr:unknown [Zea mays]AAB91423.1 chloroplast-derived orf31 [Zea mays]
MNYEFNRFSLQKDVYPCSLSDNHLFPNLVWG